MPLSIYHTVFVGIAAVFRDYREMLDELDEPIDAVVGRPGPHRRKGALMVICEQVIAGPRQRWLLSIGGIWYHSGALSLRCFFDIEDEIVAEQTVWVLNL